MKEKEAKEQRPNEDELQKSSDNLFQLRFRVLSTDSFLLRKHTHTHKHIVIFLNHIFFSFLDDIERERKGNDKRKPLFEQLNDG